jgi:hypothetical protein
MITADACRIMRHESMHGAAFAAYGYVLEEITWNGKMLCGQTRFTHAPERSPLVRAFELSVCFLVPSLHDPWGNDLDMAELDRIRASSERLKPAEIHAEAARLVADPMFIDRRLRIERALMSSLRLDAYDLAELVV